MNSTDMNIDSPESSFGRKRLIFRLERPMIAALLVSFVLICSSIAGCGGRENTSAYEAEKALFSARKLRDDVFRGSIREPFLDQAIQGYRDVVKEYRAKMADDEALGLIVVTAQMELAELEFRTGRLPDALEAFDEAIDLAAAVPPARANALYSCGVISEEMRDAEGAIRYYERFAGDYLAHARLSETARMNMRYLQIPIQLSTIYRSAGNNEKASSWLDRAEEMYFVILENEESAAIRKEVGYNLLTAYLQGKQWKRAMERIDELEKTYGEDRNRPALVFIRAMIAKEGFDDPEGAYDLYMKVYDEYPESAEAPRALLAAADIRFGEKRYDEARKIYLKVIDEFSGSGPEVVQAEWQTARLLEAGGDWNGASLKYKEIYKKYPSSEQGLLAPLVIIKNYIDKKEMDAARAAYGQAVEHYEQLVSSQVPTGVRILAESHLVTAHADMEEWEKAADLLLQLPERYPYYPRFRENYLTAASIYEKQLDDASRASGALRICMERYPGSPLAAEAEKQYRRLEERR